MGPTQNEAGHEGWGDPQSPVKITSAFGSEHPRFDVVANVVERWGCDASPIEPSTREGGLTLKSYVWPDQLERFRQLAAALDVARRVPARVDQGNAPDWVETALRDSVSGVATVVYHSIMWQYLSALDRARLDRIMALAGEAATADKPLAWLRFEPADNVVEARLQLWPPGKDWLLAKSGFHGKPVDWLGV